MVMKLVGLLMSSLISMCTAHSFFVDIKSKFSNFSICMCFRIPARSLTQKTKRNLRLLLRKEKMKQPRTKAKVCLPYLSVVMLYGYISMFFCNFYQVLLIIEKLDVKS